MPGGERLMPVDTGTETSDAPPVIETGSEPRIDFDRLTPQQQRELKVQAYRELLGSGGSHLPGEEIPETVISRTRRTRDGKEVPDDCDVITYTSSQGIPIDVIWPKSQDEAEKRIRNLLGTIEIRKSDATQLTALEHQNFSSVLEILEAINDPKKSMEENKKQQAWASRMRLEIKSRLVFHGAFNIYESGEKGLQGVCGAAKGLAPDFFNAIFEIEEKIKKTDGGTESFNPFVEALQYYEDHGHEFARANSEAGRPKFGKKAQSYLINYVDKAKLGIDPSKSENDFTPAELDSYNKYVAEQLQEQTKTRFSEDINSQIGIDSTKVKDNFTAEEKQIYQEYEESGKLGEFIKQKIDQALSQNSNKSRDELYKELYLNNKLDEKEFAWAQNMAERLFRFTGRAMMYDYLVVNKDRKDDPNKPEVGVGIDYEGPGKPTWASGRDGADYPMSKILRFREYLKAEAGLMRSHIELMDGVDLYGGDFWTRTVDKCKGKNLTYTKFPWDHEPAGKEFGMINGKRVRVKVSDGKEVELSKAEIKDQDEELRVNDDNYGERVGKINFRLLRRTPKAQSKEAEGFDFRITEFEGEDLTEMGATPMGLWAVRYIEGPDGGKKALSDDPSSFLLNPNFESLGKLLNSFDYSKAESWETKKHLLRNFIKFARSEKIEGTGKEKYSEDEILAGVNKLTGLTDKNGVQFVQLPERAKILQEFFDIKVSEGDRAKIESKIRQKFPGADDSVVAEKVDKEINKKLNYIIAKKLGGKFLMMFFLELILGTIKGAFKDLLGGVGIK